MKAHVQSNGMLVCCLLGIGAYWAWSGASMISATFWQNTDGSLSHTLWLANAGAHGLTLLLLCVLSGRFAPFGNRRTLLIGSPALVIIGTAAIFLLQRSGSIESMSIVGSLIAGVGTAGILVIWAEALTLIESVTIRRFVLSGSVVAGLLMVLVIVCLPQAFSFPLTLLLPVFAVACINRAFRLADTGEQREADDSHDDSASENNRSALVWILVCCFSFAIPTGLFQNRYTNASSGSAIEIWGTMFSCVLMLVAVVSLLDYFFTKRYGSSMFSKLIVPFIAGGLLAFPFFTAGIEIGAAVFILTGYHLFLIYIYAEFSSISVERGLLPARIFALGTAVIDLGLVVGSLLAGSVATLSAEWFTGVTLGVVYLLMLVGILLFPKIVESLSHRGSDKKAVRSFHKAEIQDPFSYFKERCHAITERYGLSAREEEVLSYLLRGRSLRSIASETFLSYNTVKTHVSHIYQKLSVHTREELIGLFESTAP